MLVVFRIGAVASTYTGWRGEFFATELAEAGMFLIGLTCQLVLVVARMGTVARAYGTGTAELLSAEAADEISASLAASQDMLVVLGVGAVTSPYTSR